MSKQQQFIVIASDSFGAPRAWGSGPTPSDAREECERQANVYVQEKRSLGEHVTLTISSASPLTARTR